ncbi:hypothetical protein HYD28_01525 [Pseudoalteromonas shioyasakiensis]|nr:hypothetical protein HYD28_01525 [Pseudoalteromonas shioyasakiensis]
MLYLTENLKFKGQVEFVTQTSPCYQSPNYPPKEDFVLSINQEGQIVSRYGDDVWDFTSFGGDTKYKFYEYDETNKKLFKQLMYYIIYSHLFPGKYRSLNAYYIPLSAVFRSCSSANVIASELHRYPKVIEGFAKQYAQKSPSLVNSAVCYFNKILKNREQIGFTLLDDAGIALYKQFDPKHQSGQNAYIPNRIWLKFVQNLDEILNNFELYKDELSNLYNYLAGTVKSNLNKVTSHYEASPFNKHSSSNKERYNGSFEDYLNEHGLMELFEKYVSRPALNNGSTYNIDQFSCLLNSIVISCYLYVLYYSIMRKEEALSLRVGCFVLDRDERLGDYCLLVGETTKTDPDNDARWVVPKRLERVISVAETLVGWKLRHVTTSDFSAPLFQNMAVWQASHRTSKTRKIGDYSSVTAKAEKVFKPQLFKITQEDYSEALALTPSLAKQEWFKVGQSWKFNFHQFRRTLAVHFALNKVSASSVQQQMKHGTREQQFHYQNNAGRLRLNQNAEREVVNEYYAEMARNITSVVQGELIAPHSKSPVKPEVIHFIKDGDRKKLLKAQKNGAIVCRSNIIGFCLKQGVCEFGGFDSIVNCAGGNESKMCPDLIIDGDREQEFKDDKAHYQEQISKLVEGSPRYESLKKEVEAYDSVLEIIKRERSIE